MWKGNEMFQKRKLKYKICQNIIVLAEKFCFQFSFRHFNQHVNSKLKKHPQFVVMDANKQYFFVIVRVVTLPENPNNYDIVWMETFKKHAISHNAKVMYAGVGLGNPNDESLPVYLDQE